MRLCELFDIPNVAIEEIDGDEALHRYGLVEVRWAYVFEVDKEKIVVYFEQYDASIVIAGFARVIKKGEVSHELSGKGNSVKIISTVVYIIDAVLNVMADEIETLYIAGFTQRQTVFYKILLRRILHQLPKGYSAWINPWDEKFYVTRVPEKLTSRYNNLVSFK